MKDHEVNVWLVNTGWIKGGYGSGERIKLKHSRAIVESIYNDKLAQAPVVTDPIFGFRTVTEVPEVPSDILVPRNSWADQTTFDTSARKLADLFLENFKAYEGGTSHEIISGGPKKSGERS